MIYSLTFTNTLDESITLTLMSPEQSGFYVKSVDGLDPPKATINTNDVLGGDGGYFNSSRLASRNIVLSLGYYWTKDTTVEELRLKSYKYFPPKEKVTISVVTDKFPDGVITEGYVESNEADIFSRDAGAVISIICPNSYFWEDGSVTDMFAGVIPSFEFPFSNESTSESLISMGELISTQYKNVYNPGDTEVGVVITLTFSSYEATNPAVYNLTTQQGIEISSVDLHSIVGGLTDGDKIVIDTRRGHKTAVIIRGGNEFNILATFNDSYEWIQLAKGDNVFYVNSDSGVVYMAFEIEHQSLYIGV